MEDSDNCVSSTSLFKPWRSAQLFTLLPCRVCGDKATGFHYGQNTCEACKAFFTRSLKRIKSYKCFGSDDCEIGRNEERMCPSCRFRKCLSIGMSKADIKTGRYTLEKHTQNILEVKELESRNLTAAKEAKMSSMQISDKTRCIEFSDQHENHTLSILYLPSVFNDIIHLIVQAHDACLPSVLMSAEKTLEAQKFYHEEYTLKRALFGPRTVLSKELYEEVYQATGIDVDDRRKMMINILEDTEYILRGITSFLKSTQLFSELTIADKSRLLQAACGEFLHLEYMNGYNRALQVHVHPSGICFHEEELNTLKDYMMVNPSVVSSTQPLNLKHEELVIVVAICIVTTDRCKLDDPQKVAEIQWKLTQCLMHLLEKNHHDHKRLFARIIDRLCLLRKVVHVVQNKYPSMSTWPGYEKFDWCSWNK